MKDIIELLNQGKEVVQAGDDPDYYMRRDGSEVNLFNVDNDTRCDYLYAGEVLDWLGECDWVEYKRPVRCKKTVYLYRDDEGYLFLSESPLSSLYKLVHTVHAEWEEVQ